MNVRSPYSFLDTPALLIDAGRLAANITAMQRRAGALGVKLRPHTKTHKMPEIARMQLDAGAVGITVAKVGEAEAMAAAGLHDIFIANEIIGAAKWDRIIALAPAARVIFGADSAEAVRMIEAHFASRGARAEIRVEIETGENRSGVTCDDDFLRLLAALKEAPHIRLEGIFSHEGHSYSAHDAADCQRLFEEAQRITLHYAQLARSQGFGVESVSVGSTPSIMHSEKLLPGITELRPGTYALMDAGQSAGIGTYEYCAATVLATVISKPADRRVICDAGAKALTKESRGPGLCHTEGFGIIRGSGGVHVTKLYDEHTVIENKELHDSVEIGDKIEIIPNHICPVCNLYDEAYLVSEGRFLRKMKIAGRGRTQ
ncbi:MAG: alanine racemase [Pyramidobacter sp.]|jgi:D-serine deaminase-like pyridoxal phosphate-dependent protein